MAEIIDPRRKYEVRDQVTPVLSAWLGATVGTNQSLVGAVSGQVVRVMGFILQSTAATVGSVLFKSASGGTVLGSANAPANTQGNFFAPITDSGYFATTSGQGLYVDVYTTDTNITVFYITHTGA